MAKSSRYANCAGIPAAQYAVFGSSAAACNPFFPENPHIQEIAHKQHRLQFRRHLSIEVVDDTAVIGNPILAKAKNQNQNQKKKAMKRKAWKIKKTAAGDDGKAAYPRAEMLALGRQNSEAHRKKWSEVYAGLSASVAAEYDGLVAPPMRGAFPTFAFHHRPSFLEKPHNFDAAATATAMGKGSPQKISVH